MAVFDAETFDPLRRDPEREVRGWFAGIPFAAEVVIPRYGERVARHYRGQVGEELLTRGATTGAPFLDGFGLAIRFERMAELAIHDPEMTLDESMRALVGCFGPVILRNACVAHDVRKSFHRNIFPHLRFHVDRGPAMPNQYSCFTRDPFDPEQRGRRASSTLFVPNAVARIEAARTQPDARDESQLLSCDLFHGVVMKPILGEIVLEQPWDEPDGIGEIAVADNRTVLHATYHKDGTTKGYPIGTRYLV